MKRREFIVGGTTAGISGIAGCSDSATPVMEFQNFVVPDPRMVSQDADGEEYVATIQNTRDGGEIAVELWYYRSPDTPRPGAAATYLNGEYQDRHFESAKARYFAGGERRDIAVTGDDHPLMESDSFDYGFALWPASHGAVFENTGGSGEIEFRFEYQDTQGYNPREPPNKLDSVGRGKTIEIVFNTVIPPLAKYDIVAEPV
ncbi:hypothetical protein NDI56_00155 [Haloarcula sp. S1CR25-12]|uniref:Tat pathway signal sequence domain protein n=1 Tax=Haloarcula saliterrae TaxID=2950534 RepID=A0ABU2F6J3_9EURY|nr:hypothetical protein [Haloarcula sp. S1CR25-12]MDS0257812.1 hypothetical protein [Haloarcula sp. S1CR25-12]